MSLYFFTASYKESLTSVENEAVTVMLKNVQLVSAWLKSIHNITWRNGVSEFLKQNTQMTSATKPSSWPFNAIGWIMSSFQGLDFLLTHTWKFFTSFILPLKVSLWSSVSPLGLATVTYTLQASNYANLESRTHLLTRLVLSSWD